MKVAEDPEYRIQNTEYRMQNMNMNKKRPKNFMDLNYGNSEQLFPLVEEVSKLIEAYNKAILYSNTLLSDKNV